jgi:hypothetical protein
MSTPEHTAALEKQIDQWRSYLNRRQAIHTVDVAELEDHLREQIAGLTASGLAQDEAFLVAVKRMGNLDELSREFAREHSDRLWKQLVVAPPDTGERRAGGNREALVAFGLGAGAALAIKTPGFLGNPLTEITGFYARNLSLFVLPFLTAFFVWKRGVSRATILWLLAAFAAAIGFINAYPFLPGGHTEVLAALHLPIALWLAVGIAYAGKRWSEVAGRMDFIRFSGELFIYYVLIALGGGVFTAFMMLIFNAIGIDAEPFLQSWLLPCGATGAVLVASWLVEAKQSVIENMAPVLTRLFTPLFAALLLVFLVTVFVTGRGLDIERDMLIAFDLLLAVVLALLVYSVSARDPHAPPGLFDVMQVVLVVSALLVDAVALWNIGSRISEYGFTPNRVAALGENLILLANLTWSAVLYVRFLRGQGPFTSIERWQTAYLPIYAAWAAIVVLLFPVIFGFR